MPTTLTHDQIQARLQLVEEHTRAENAHDLDGIMRTFGKDPLFVLNANTIPLCVVFPFDQEGKLAGERVYLDGASLLKQLGVLS